MLKERYSTYRLEAGCDEAGRGCLAGPVFAAAVILPEGFCHPDLDDSKKMAEKKRTALRQIIESDSLAWAVAMVDNREIDRINILRASIKAMHLAIEGLRLRPEFLLIDGNRFTPFRSIPHRCIIKGDALYMSIAAASVLAKTYRDEYMAGLDAQFPMYGWRRNKGYPTPAHRKAITIHGLTDYHRKTFRLLDPLSLSFC